jgi:hypothetical protein
MNTKLRSETTSRKDKTVRGLQVPMDFVVIMNEG